MAAAFVLAALLLPAAVPASRAEAPATQAGYDWYRYQGASDSGPSASVNCEITSIAMSIQYSRDNLRVPISTVREFVGRDGPTFTSDARRALTNWAVPYRGVQTVREIMDALARGHIVMVGLIMNRISPGADYQKGYSPPSQRFGRYNSYEGAHSVVVKGVTEDQGWFIVNDPNVWDNNPIYWYSDGTPKGKDRYYPVGEVTRAMNDLGDYPRGLEILAAAPASVVIDPAGPQVQLISLVEETLPPPPAPPVLYPRQSGDIAALGSLGIFWKSVTLTFRMANPRTDAIEVAQVGVQGRDPTGAEFFAAHGPATIRPGSDLAFAIPMVAEKPGVWQVRRVLYFAEDQWRELPSSGFLQQMDFVVR